MALGQNSKLALSTDDNEDGSMLANNSSSRSIHLSTEEQLNVIDCLISNIKIRQKFIDASRGVSNGISRSLTYNNSTLIEISYKEVLAYFFLKLEQRSIYELIFQRAVDSRVIWDIIKQNIRLNCSFPMPRPPMHDGAQKERQIMNSLRNIADACVVVKNGINSKQDKDEEYLINKTKYVDHLQKLRKLKQTQQKPLLQMSIGEKKVELIKGTNTINGIITNLMSNSNINFLEQPELVDIIRKSRHVITNSSIKEESKFVMNEYGI